VYQLAIDDFVIWYCSEPRLAFNKTVVLRYRLAYRLELEARRLAPAAINLRLAAVRRLVRSGRHRLLSPDLAAGIRCAKGAKKIGVRLGNWLTVEQSRSLLRTPNTEAVTDGIMRFLPSCSTVDCAEGKWPTCA